MPAKRFLFALAALLCVACVADKAHADPYPQCRNGMCRAPRAVFNLNVAPVAPAPVVVRPVVPYTPAAVVYQRPSVVYYQCAPRRWNGNWCGSARYVNRRCR